MVLTDLGSQKLVAAWLPVGLFELETKYLPQTKVSQMNLDFSRDCAWTRPELLGYGLTWARSEAGECVNRAGTS